MAQPTRDDLLKLGFNVTLEGDLARLRQKVGLTRNAMARLIGVDAEGLREWEALRRAMTLETALRIGEWFWWAEEALSELSDSGVNVRALVPASVAAQHLGVTTEDLENGAHMGNRRHEVLGVLGTFLYRADFPKMSR
jgi:DNA-binding XRE family transcriptional regulator